MSPCQSYPDYTIAMRGYDFREGQGSKFDQYSHLVRATLANETPVQVQFFATEGEAGRWIKNASVAWVHARNHKGAI
jgi:hypothetical protein